MAITPADAIKHLPFQRAATDALASGPSEIERKVIDLFDQFRIPLLR